MKYNYVKPLLSEMLESKDMYQLSVFLSEITGINLSKWYLNDFENIISDMANYSSIFQSAVIITAFIDCYRGRFIQFSLKNSYHYLESSVIHGTIDPNNFSELLILLVEKTLNSKVDFFKDYNLNVNEYKILLSYTKNQVDKISNILDKLLHETPIIPITHYFDFLTYINNTLNDIFYIKLVKESIASDLEELKKSSLKN